MDKFEQFMTLAKARSDLEKARKDIISFEALQKMLFRAYQYGGVTVDEFVDRMQEIDKKIMDNKEMLYNNLKTLDRIRKEAEEL